MFRQRKAGSIQSVTSQAIDRRLIRQGARRALPPLVAVAAFFISGCTRPPCAVREFHPDGMLKIEQQMERTADGDTVQHGRYRSYHPNGKLMEEGAYLHGKIHGLWTTYDDTGRKRGEQQFSQGQRHGVWKSYHPNGQLARQWQYDHGRKQGEWLTFDKTGYETGRELYERDVQKHPGEGRAAR